MMTHSGARIDVDKTIPNVCRVRIAGTDEQIDVAKSLIAEATKFKSRPPGGLEGGIVVPPASHGAGPNPSADLTNCVSASVHVPSNMVSKVIGRAGSTIHSLQAQTGARIWVNAEAQEAQILGPVEAVELAKEAVAALVADDPNAQWNAANAGVTEAQWQQDADWAEINNAAAPTSKVPKLVIPPRGAGASAADAWGECGGAADEWASGADEWAGATDEWGGDSQAGRKPILTIKPKGSGAPPAEPWWENSMWGHQI
jgi:hypothetical protein